MSHEKKKHLIRSLIERFGQPRHVVKPLEDADPSTFDFVGGVYCGIAASTLMQGFMDDGSQPPQVVDQPTQDDPIGAGGTFGGGGAGGSFDPEPDPTAPQDPAPDQFDQTTQESESFDQTNDSNASYDQTSSSDSSSSDSSSSSFD